MRTIKFRGKTELTGEWVYGFFSMGSSVRFEHPKQDERIVPRYLIDDGLLHDVIPETVGQFTGLTDKNGKEVFEGDIIAFYELKTYCINPDCDPHLLGYSERLHKKIKAVRFEDGMFGVDSEYCPIDSFAYLGDWAADEDYMEELKNDPYFDTNGYDLDDVIGFEAVGNVFDNPELLKGGDK